MKIKTNSIHAKIYRFVYSSDLPMNLCPYFWSLIWAIVVFIPDLIIKLPVLLWNLTTDTNQKTEKKEQRGIGFAVYVLTGIFILWIISTYNLIKYWFNCYSYNNQFAEIGGFINIIFMFIILVILYAAYDYEIGEFKDSLLNKSENNIIIQFIKAKYNKYCPKIDWE